MARNHASARTLSEWVIWAQSEGMTDISETPEGITVDAGKCFIFYIARNTHYFYIRQIVLLGMGLSCVLDPHL